MGLVSTFCWLIALNGSTWYYSGPGYPQGVFESELGVKCLEISLSDRERNYFETQRSKTPF